MAEHIKELEKLSAELTAENERALASQQHAKANPVHLPTFDEVRARALGRVAVDFDRVQGYRAEVARRRAAGETTSLYAVRAGAAVAGRKERDVRLEDTTSTTALTVQQWGFFGLTSCAVMIGALSLYAARKVSFIAIGGVPLAAVLGWKTWSAYEITTEDLRQIYATRDLRAAKRRHVEDAEKVKREDAAAVLLAKQEAARKKQEEDAAAAEAAQEQEAARALAAVADEEQRRKDEALAKLAASIKTE